eukprot:338826_1
MRSASDQEIYRKKWVRFQLKMRRIQTTREKAGGTIRKVLAVQGDEFRKMASTTMEDMGVTNRRVQRGMTVGKGAMSFLKGTEYLVDTLESGAASLIDYAKYGFYGLAN